MLQETDALVVVAADFLPVFDHLDPLARPPSGDSGERLAARVVNIGPEVQAHGRVDVHPLQAAVGKPCSGRSDGLANGEIDIVWGNAKLSGADPELCQPRVDVHECRPPRAGEHSRIDSVMKVQ